MYAPSTLVDEFPYTIRIDEFPYTISIDEPPPPPVQPVCIWFPQLI